MSDFREAWASGQARDGVAVAVAGTLGLRLITTILTLVASVIAARLLGPSLRGELAVMLILPAVTSATLLLGLDSANLALAGRSPGTYRVIVKYSATYGTGAGGMAMAALLMIGINVPAVRLGLELPHFVMSVAMIPPLVVASLLAAAESGRQRPWKTNIVLAAGMVVYLSGLVVLAIAENRSAPLAFISWASGQVAVLFLFVWFARRPKVPVEHMPLRRYLSFGLGTYASSIVLLALLRLDIPFVQLLSGADQVGFYAVVLPFGEGILLLSTAFTIVALPRIALGSLELPQLLEMARALFLLSALLAVVLGIFGPAFVPWLYGSEFSPAVIVLLVLLPGIVFLCASRPLYLYLIGTRRHATAATAAVVPLVVAVALDLVLIPDFGAVGAAAASTAAYAGHAVLLWVLAVSQGHQALTIPYAPSAQTVRLLLIATRTVAAMTHPALRRDKA